MLTENLQNEKIKNIKAKGNWEKNTPNYHVGGVEQNTLIDLQNGGLDDIQSFNCDMYNFGDMEDLPDSDRDMISSIETCKEYQF